MGIFTVTYALYGEIYNVQVMVESAEAAELTIQREHADATIITVSVVA